VAAAVMAVVVAMIGAAVAVMTVVVAAVALAEVAASRVVRNFAASLPRA